MTFSEELRDFALLYDIERVTDQEIRLTMIFFSLQLNTFNKTFIHNVWLNQFNTPDTTLNEYTSIEHMSYPVELVNEKPHL